MSEPKTATAAAGSAPVAPERPRAVTRLAAGGDACHVYDLRAALAGLRAEEAAAPGQRRHRQVTVSHRGPVTQALFDFAPGGELAEHAANGWVTIQVLEGRLTVSADGEAHDLGAGGVASLAPRVRHSVRAAEDGEGGGVMLLTVCLAEAHPQP